MIVFCEDVDNCGLFTVVFVCPMVAGDVSVLVIFSVDIFGVAVETLDAVVGVAWITTVTGGNVPDSNFSEFVILGENPFKNASRSNPGVTALLYLDFTGRLSPSKYIVVQLYSLIVIGTQLTDSIVLPGTLLPSCFN